MFERVVACRSGIVDRRRMWAGSLVSPKFAPSTGKCQTPTAESITCSIEHVFGKGEVVSLMSSSAALSSPGALGLSGGFAGSPFGRSRTAAPQRAARVKHPLPVTAPPAPGGSAPAPSALARSVTGRPSPDRSVPARSIPARPAAPARSRPTRPAAPARPVSTRPAASRPASARSARPLPAVAARPAAPAIRLTRRGRLVLLLLATGLLLSIFSLGRMTADASSGPAVHRTVTVRPGETLWELAGRIAPQTDRRDTVAQIRQLNHLRSAMLLSGQQLQLP